MPLLRYLFCTLPDRVQDRALMDVHFWHSMEIVMDQYGTLVIFTHVTFNGFNGRETKRVVLHTERAQQQQAKGLVMDFRGMNPGLHFAAEWKPDTVTL